MGKNSQKRYIAENSKEETGEESSLLAEEVKEKELKENSKVKKKTIEEEEQQQRIRENDPPDAEEDGEGKRKLKGSKQKQKHKLKKNAKQKEEKVEERKEGTHHEEKHEEKGRKPQENGDLAVDAETTKMGKQKLQKKQVDLSTRSMFADGFEERRDLEQYFWSERTVLQLMQALRPTTWHSEHGHVCCLAAPSLAHAFYSTQGRAEALLDIDKRFDYLPSFRFFDLCNPSSFDSDDFRIVVFDPPFFYIPLPTLFQAVLVAVHGNLQAKLLVGFLRREEGAFLQTFAPFHLRRTRFVLEYATVKPNKWCNYALYANIDLPGIKRIS